MGYSDKTELESNQLLSAIVRFRGLYERNEVDKLSQTLNPKQLQVLTPIFDHMDWELYSSYFEAHKYFEKTNAG